MIHRFHLDDMFIVTDTCSGSVHVMDEIAYEMTGMYEEAGKEEVIRRAKERFGTDAAELEECYDQITALKDAGHGFKGEDRERAARESAAFVQEILTKTEPDALAAA